MYINTTKGEFPSATVLASELKANGILVRLESIKRLARECAGVWTIWLADGSKIHYDPADDELQGFIEFSTKNLAKVRVEASEVIELNPTDPI